MGCHGGGLRGFATVGGLKWHAMRVGRPLRSTEGVGVELQRVAGWQAYWRSKHSVTEWSLCTKCRVITVFSAFSSGSKGPLQNSALQLRFSVFSARPAKAWTIRGDLTGINNNSSRQQQFVFSTIPPPQQYHHRLKYTVHVSLPTIAPIELIIYFIMIEAHCVF